jgi:L,D-transpeptidase ErfK/SrfK
MTTSPQFSRRIAVLLPFLLLAGCASLDNFLEGLRGRPGEVPVPLRERALLAPIPANHFVLDSPDQSVVGEPQVVFTRQSDTLSDLARAYGLGYDELVAANPGVDPWLPGDNTPVLLPTQLVLPDVPREGIVLNIASKRLFYFPAMPEGAKQVVKTYPIGIGRVGWETPLGMTTVVAKARDPHWYVPASVRREHAEMDNPLPSVVPPGPDNPLGHRVLQLEMPGYLIHGTNQPYGVGMRVSHGCVRLYPENIELLYELVEVGEPVALVNQPYLLGERGGELYFESHQPLEDDSITPADRIAQLLDVPLAAALTEREKDHVRTLASIASGLPSRVSAADSDEVFARVRPVQNIVEQDPAAPTLSEVREMIDEAVREAQAETASENL